MERNLKVTNLTGLKMWNNYCEKTGTLTRKLDMGKELEDIIEKAEMNVPAHLMSFDITNMKEYFIKSELGKLVFLDLICKYIYTINKSRSCIEFNVSMDADLFEINFGFDRNSIHEYRIEDYGDNKLIGLMSLSECVEKFIEGYVIKHYSSQLGTFLISSHDVRYKDTEDFGFFGNYFEIYDRVESAYDKIQYTFGFDYKKALEDPSEVKIIVVYNKKEEDDLDKRENFYKHFYLSTDDESDLEEWKQRYQTYERGLNIHITPCGVTEDMVYYSSVRIEIYKLYNIFRPELSKYHNSVLKDWNVGSFDELIDGLRLNEISSFEEDINLATMKEGEINQEILEKYPDSNLKLLNRMSQKMTYRAIYKLIYIKYLNHINLSRHIRKDFLYI